MKPSEVIVRWRRKNTVYKNETQGFNGVVKTTKVDVRSANDLWGEIFSMMRTANECRINKICEANSEVMQNNISACRQCPMNSFPSPTPSLPTVGLTTQLHEFNFTDKEVPSRQKADKVVLNTKVTLDLVSTSNKIHITQHLRDFHEYKLTQQLSRIVTFLRLNLSTKIKGTRKIDHEKSFTRTQTTPGRKKR